MKTANMYFKNFIIQKGRESHQKAKQSYEMMHNLFTPISEAHLQSQSSIQMPNQKTAYEKAQRFAQLDSSFSRVYTVLPKLSEKERFEMAKLEIKKIDGITDTCDFVRYRYGNYGLKSEDLISEILNELD